MSSSQQTLAQQQAALAIVPITDEGPVGIGDEDLPVNPNRWFFDKARLENTPSRRSGIDSDKELSYRQQAANFIQDIGQRLQVNQLCINTAIVYMHRFFMYHSFTHFHRNSISTASIFLAAKVEEQPRKLDHVIKVSHYCLHRDQPAIDPKSDAYQEQSTELVMNENILLQTLGFDVAIDHPHTHVVKCCQLVRGESSALLQSSKDLAQTSYFMATNSLHLTTMCLQYKPTVVACVCIHLACKWSSWEIPRSKEGKDWWMYVDDTVTEEQLEKLTAEFLIIFNKSPSRLKRKIISLNAATSGGTTTIGLLNVPGIAGLTGGVGLGDTSLSGQPSGSSANRSHSRSPSPKRPRVVKPGEGHTGMMGSSSGSNMMMHHGMKPPSNHHGQPPPPPGSKVPHPSSGSMKPQQHPSSKASSHLPGAKDHHSQQQQFNIKDPHHPHYQQIQQQGVKNPYSGHGHHPPQYPHGTSSGRPPSSSVPNAQVRHSHSGSSQPVQGGQQQQKPRGTGSSSLHPPGAAAAAPSSYGSSSSGGGPPQQQKQSSTLPSNKPPPPSSSSQQTTSSSHNLLSSQSNTLQHSSTNSSSSSHLNHPSAPSSILNQNPATISSKNHNQIHPHAKKPYERTDYVKREGPVPQIRLGSEHHQLLLRNNMPPQLEKPGEIALFANLIDQKYDILEKRCGHKLKNRPPPPPPMPTSIILNSKGVHTPFMPSVVDKAPVGPPTIPPSKAIGQGLFIKVEQPKMTKEEIQQHVARIRKNDARNAAHPTFMNSSNFTTTTISGNSEMSTLLSSSGPPPQSSSNNNNNNNNNKPNSSSASGSGNMGVFTRLAMPSVRTASLFSPDFKDEESPPTIPSLPSMTMSMTKAEQGLMMDIKPSLSGNVGNPPMTSNNTTIPPFMIRPTSSSEGGVSVDSKMFEVSVDDSKDGSKHKKKKKEKHKHKEKDKDRGERSEHKEKHKEKKEHKKERHKDKGGKHKHKDRPSNSSSGADSHSTLMPSEEPGLGPGGQPQNQKIKIKLTINKGDKGGVSLGGSKKNSNLRQ